MSNAYINLTTLLSARGYDKGMYFTHEECSSLFSLINARDSRIAELEELVRELLAEGEYLSMLNGLVDNDSDWKQLVDKANKTLPEVQE